MLHQDYERIPNIINDTLMFSCSHFKRLLYLIKPTLFS